jgi:hypothetical protein
MKPRNPRYKQQGCQSVVKHRKKEIKSILEIERSRANASVKPVE